MPCPRGTGRKALPANVEANSSTARDPERHGASDASLSPTTGIEVTDAPCPLFEPANMSWQNQSGGLILGEKATKPMAEWRVAAPKAKAGGR